MNSVGTLAAKAANEVIKPAFGEIEIVKLGLYLRKK